MSESNDAILVSNCLKGNTKAFETLIDKYQKPIFNVAHRMVNDYEDAQDITQSVFVKAFENLDRFNPKFKFFSWIYRMVINESINFLNKRRPDDDVDSKIISKGKSPEQNYLDIELREKVQNALMELKIDYRVVILLRHFEEFSYDEMSYILDIPEKKVKSRLFTARQQLRTILLKQGTVTND